MRTTKFMEKHESDVSNSIVSRVITFKKHFAEDIKKYFCKRIGNTFDGTEHVYCRQCAWPVIFPSVVSHLSCDNTSAERSFPKLKLIKNYERNAMSESLLSSLAVLSIEHGETQRTDINQILNKFILSKKRCHGTANYTQLQHIYPGFLRSPFLTCELYSLLLTSQVKISKLQSVFKRIFQQDKCLCL